MSKVNLLHSIKTLLTGPDIGVSSNNILSSKP